MAEYSSQNQRGLARPFFVTCGIGALARRAKEDSGKGKGGDSGGIVDQERTLFLFIPVPLLVISGVTGAGFEFRSAKTRGGLRRTPRDYLSVLRVTGKVRKQNILIMYSLQWKLTQECP